MKKEIKELTKLIFSTSKLIQKNFKRTSQENEKSFGCVRILFFIEELRNPTMNEIADYLGVTPPSATSLINNFVGKGLLKRVFDQIDRRVVRLMITEKGRKILKKGFKEMILKTEEILSRLDKKQVLNLKEILETLSKHYENAE